MIRKRKDFLFKSESSLTDSHFANCEAIILFLGRLLSKVGLSLKSQIPGVNYWKLINFQIDSPILADKTRSPLMKSKLFSSETYSVSKKAVLLVTTVVLSNSLVSLSAADRSDFVLPEYNWSSSSTGTAPIYESLDGDLSSISL